jgi:hypothetical protein
MSSLTVKMEAFCSFQRRSVLPNITAHDPEDLHAEQHPYDNLKYQKGVTCDTSVSGIRIGHILHSSGHTITQVMSQ